VTRHPLFALLSLALACGGSSTDESEPTGGDTATTGSTQPVAVTDGEPTIPESARVPLTEVELLEPGEGERVELRLSAEVGQTERMRMEQVMTMQIQLGGQQVPEVEMPPIQMDFELRTTHIGDDGAMRHESRVIALQVLGEGPLVPRLEQELAPMRDLSGWDVVDARGRLVASRYDLPASASPELRNSLQRMQDAMRQLMPPLPEAPVGVGARWRAVSDIRSQIAFRQTSTYTLESIEDGRIVLSVQTEQSADPQPMESDQPGVTAELLAFDGEASTRIELALDRMVPTSEGNVAVELTTRATQNGQAQEVTMKMGTAVKATPL
jgi:hypothetical protein